jgi:hypothetical protein
MYILTEPGHVFPPRLQDGSSRSAWDRARIGSIAGLAQEQEPGSASGQAGGGGGLGAAMTDLLLQPTGDPDDYEVMLEGHVVGRIVLVAGAWSWAIDTHFDRVGIRSMASSRRAKPPRKHSRGAGLRPNFPLAYREQVPRPRVL